MKAIAINPPARAFALAALLEQVWVRDFDPTVLEGDSLKDSESLSRLTGFDAGLIQDLLDNSSGAVQAALCERPVGQPPSVREFVELAPTMGPQTRTCGTCACGTNTCGTCHCGTGTCGTCLC